MSTTSPSRRSRKMDVLISQHTRLVSLQMAQELVVHHLNTFLHIGMKLACRIVCDQVHNLWIRACKCVRLLMCVMSLQ